MKTLVVFSRSSTQRPRSVGASLAQWLIDHGDEVTLLDVTDFSYANQDLPPRWFARLRGHDVYPGAFRRALDTMGARYLALRYTGHQQPDLPAPVASELTDAVFSDLVTYLRSDDIDITRGHARRVSRVMTKKATELYFALTELLGGETFDQVYVPNGRVPEQRLALEACKSRSVPVLYYEIGRARPHAFYAGKTQVHDREATQAEIPEVLDGLSPDEIEKLATQWLEERTSAGSVLNVYSAGWHQADNTTPSSSSRAVFFSSSVDEFASYGAAWKLDQWDSQYQAFDAIMTVLQGQGVACTLRVHPNLTNKSPEYFGREVAEIHRLARQHPDLRVLWHNEPVNSYCLVAESEFIFVGRSTLGLESSLMGKCVWTTTAARYDTVADIRQVMSPHDVTEENLSLWSVDPSGAQRFVAYWAVQDHPFRWGEDSWSTWDSFRTPPGLRWGQLLIRNPLAHKMHVIRLELAKRRNERFHPQSPKIGSKAIDSSSQEGSP